VLEVRLEAIIAIALLVLAWATPARAQDACMTSMEATQELRKSGKLVEAREQAVVCGQGSCPDVIGKKCREWVQELDGIIPSVVVTVKDPSGKDSTAATLQIDGKPHPMDGRAIQLDPGQHVFVAQLQGQAPLREEVLIGEGDSNRRIVLSYAPKQGPAPGAAAPGDGGGVHVLVWIGFGVAAAGVVAGAVTGGLALGGGASIDENCNDKLCPESERESYDRSLLLAHVSTVSFAVAGAGAALGVVGLLLSDFGGSEEMAVQPLLGPGYLGLGGRF
jgi:hypothetical protein